MSLTANMGTAGLNSTYHLDSCRLMHQRFWAVCSRVRDHIWNSHFPLSGLLSQLSHFMQCCFLSYTEKLYSLMLAKTCGAASKTMSLYGHTLNILKHVKLLCCWRWWTAIFSHISCHVFSELWYKWGQERYAAVFGIITCLA